ncbi:MAG TPA: hypothetical protein PK129_09040 [Cellvibrionaceae bacterium]|nr:hypothetical protein [Cellvibrionaceae bacterium]
MKKTITAIALLLCCSRAYSHEARQFIEKYLQDLDKDAELAGYFVERPQFIFGHHIHIPDSSAEASIYVKDAQKRLGEQQYAKSVVESTKALATIDDYSLITFTLRRLKTDGKVLDRVCSTFGVVHLTYGYKILSWQAVAPNKKGSCY